MNKPEKLTWKQVFNLSKTLPEYERKKLAALIIADTLNPLPMHDIAEEINSVAFKKQEYFDLVEDMNDLEEDLRKSLKSKNIF